ncbi:MAG: thiamine biosynthesis protein ThiS [Thermoplasmata archaeon]|nr:MAG: thiamine biosynthesis protein ThiS [Thermoplasmata archaeon]
MITVNNKDIEWIEGETVEKLLKRLKYVFPVVVVKINGEIIPMKKYSTTIIPDNAEIDIIPIISGG